MTFLSTFIKFCMSTLIGVGVCVAVFFVAEMVMAYLCSLAMSRAINRLMNGGGRGYYEDKNKEVIDKNMQERKRAWALILATCLYLLCLAPVSSVATPIVTIFVCVYCLRSLAGEEKYPLQVGILQNYNEADQIAIFRNVHNEETFQLSMEQFDMWDEDCYIGDRYVALATPRYQSYCSLQLR